MSGDWKPCACGKPSMHAKFFKGQETFQCCECYVKSGGAPADWHSECMRFAAEQNGADNGRG